jgi:DNA repair protein RadC
MKDITYKTAPERLTLGDTPAESQPCPPVNPCNRAKVNYKHLWLELCAHRRTGKLGPAIKNGNDVLGVAQDFVPEMFDSYREHGVLLLMNNRNRVVAVYEVAIGGKTSVSIDIGLAMAAALLVNAQAFIFVHNHPSGELEPSQDDITINHALAAAGRTVNIKMLDSIIVGRNPETGATATYSFALNSSIWPP